MSPQQLASEVVDLTENMDDITLSSDSDRTVQGATESKEASATSKKKRNRKSKRGGKRKGGKFKDPTSTQDGQDITRASTPLSDTPTVATFPLDHPEERRESYKRQQASNKGKGIVNVWVPVEPLFEYRALSDIEKKALSNSVDDGEKHGVFATEDIKQGTRIISEPALISLPAPGDSIEWLMWAFARLPKHEQERVWQLDPSNFSVSPLLDTLSKMTAPILKRTVHILSKDKNDWTEDEKAEFEESGAMLEHALATLRIAARWHAGCRSLIDLPEEERNALPEDTPITGLFVETAGLRHSCVPNCYAHYNRALDRMTVHTTRAITRGEELTLSSITSIYYQSADERSYDLSYKFGIKCACEACNPSHPKFKLHEAARARSNTRATIIAHFITQVEILESDKVLDDLCLSNIHRSADEPTKEDLDDLVQNILDLTKDLKTTGCEGPELIRWYNALIDRVQPRLAEMLPSDKRLAFWKVILGRASGCEMIAGRCFGEDSAEFEEVRRRTESIRGVVERAEENAKVVKEGKRKVK